MRIKKTLDIRRKDFESLLRKAGIVGPTVKTAEFDVETYSRDVSYNTAAYPTELLVSVSWYEEEDEDE